MNMIKTIIVDDEQHCIDAVLDLINEYDDFFNVLGSYRSVEAAVKATKRLKPDLVFLDVEINDETGFDFLKQLGVINFQVVFTTAYDKYAVKAFKFSALHYLLKPIDTDDFEEVVKRIEKDVLIKELDKKINVLMHNLKVKNTDKRLTIDTSEDTNVINISDILYCEADINYTDIHTIKNGKITSSKTLKTFENLLLEHGFYRVHQSYLVNLKHVKKYTKGKPAYVILSNGSRVKVSLSNKSGFLNALKNLD